MVWVLWCLLANSKRAVMCLLASVRLLWCCPQMNSGALSEWLSGSWSLTWPRPFSPWLLNLARQPALGRVWVVPNVFHSWMMEASVFLGSFNAAEIVVPCQRSVLWHNLVSENYGQLFGPHGLVFALTCTGPYMDRCAFPNHVQSIELTTGGLQSSCRNISKMINGNRMHLSSILSLIAKGLNTYVNKVFQIFLNFNLQKVFLFCHCGVLRVDWWVCFYKSHLQ
jgi:hypothetical protein